MRSVVKYLFLKGMAPSAICQEMKNTYPNKVPSLFVVQYWVRKFKCGFTDVRDEVRVGRPVSTVTETFVNQIRDLVMEDRRITISQLVFETGLSRGSVGTILHDYLNMSKVSARWVPRLLTDAMKQERKRCSAVLLEYFETVPHFFDRLVTVDESWVYLYDPEMKYQSKQWKFPSEPAPKKAKRTRSAVKVMLTVFWDSEGIILTDFLPTGRTMNGVYYSNLIIALNKKLSKKRRNKLRKGPVFLLQDNAPPHRAAVTQEAIADSGIELLRHPPYSPDLAPSDFFLFPEMKRDLKGRRFNDENQIQTVSEEWLASKPPHFYSQGLFKVKARWQKCINLNGSYVE